MNTPSWSVELYETENGQVPVLDFIRGLPAKERAKVFRDLELLAELFPFWDREHIKKLEDEELWELRIKFSSNQHRILYFTAHGSRLVAVHGFTKKDWGISPRDLKIARKRKTDWEQRFAKDGGKQ